MSLYGTMEPNKLFLGRKDCDEVVSEFEEKLHEAILGSLRSTVWRSVDRNMTALDNLQKNSDDPNMATKEKTLNDDFDGFKYDVPQVALGKLEGEQTGEDLSRNVKLLLIVGRMLGVLPFTGVLKKSYSQMDFNPKSGAAITSITILVFLILNASLGILESFWRNKKNALEIAHCIRGSIMFCWSCLIYLYFLFRGKRFLLLFHHWAKTSILYTIEDRHLKRDVAFITILVLASSILENAILHLEYIRSLDNISNWDNSANITFLETYYRRSHYHWARLVPFHEILAVIVFVQHKCMLYSCNLVDIMIAVFSRAIYYRFKMLYKLGYEHLVKPLKKDKNLSERSRMINGNGWTKLIRDHKKLWDLLYQFESFFSPLIFGSYAVNIFYICIQLLDGLSVNVVANKVVHSIYAPWSFLHVIMRVYLVSISAARINSYAHKIRAVLLECPIEFYTPEIARMDMRVTTGPDIGLTGFSSFVITKPFILKIISVVFTLEIVLLQGKPSGSEC